jgi:hypothetical protein
LINHGMTPSQYQSSGNVEWTNNKKWWTGHNVKVVTAYSEVISKNLPGGTEIGRWKMGIAYPSPHKRHFLIMYTLPLVNSHLKWLKLCFP